MPKNTHITSSRERLIWLLAACLIVISSFGVNLQAAHAATGHVPNPSSAWPSTNDANRSAARPHVNATPGVGSVTLEFVSNLAYAVNFEVRVDGLVLASGADKLTHNQVAASNGDYDPVSEQHWNTDDYDPAQRDARYPRCTFASNTPIGGDMCPTNPGNTITVTATQTVEVRQALGGEADHRFGWTVFNALPAPAVFPSTNDQNRANNWAHVNVLDDTTPGEITLEFVNPRSFASCFEYRTDGDTSQALATPNPNSLIPDRYPHICVNNDSEQRTFPLNQYIEVRLSFGAESDERFDWTRFNGTPPTTGGPQTPSTPPAGGGSSQPRPSAASAAVVSSPAPFTSITAIFASDGTVLGVAAPEATATTTDDDGEVAGSTDSASTVAQTDTDGSGKIFGLSWYWWFLMLATLAALWWFIAGRRRQDQE